MQQQLFTLLFVAVAVTSHAQEWTRFRGPNGSGVSNATLPATWTDKDVVFSVPLPGIGHSSPVVRGGKLFLQSANAETAQQHVVCLDSRTGEQRWQRDFEIAPYHIHVRNSFASVTPAVDEHHVYVAWSTPEQTTVMALDHDGNDVWARELGAFDSQHGFGTSPIIYKDLMIICHQQKKPQRNGPRTEEQFGPGDRSHDGRNSLADETVERECILFSALHPTCRGAAR